MHCILQPVGAVRCFFPNPPTSLPTHFMTLSEGEYLTESNRVSREVSRAITFERNFTRGVEILQAVMNKSEQHAVFAARKLMCDELTSGKKVRRLAIMPGTLALDPGETKWFPLPVGEVDRVNVRVKHVVQLTVCRWYDNVRDMATHLQETLAHNQGAVSWIWIELATLLVECRVPLSFACDEVTYETITNRILETQSITQGPMGRYMTLMTCFIRTNPETLVPGTTELCPIPELETRGTQAGDPSVPSVPDIPGVSGVSDVPSGVHAGSV